MGGRGTEHIPNGYPGRYGLNWTYCRGPYLHHADSRRRQGCQKSVHARLPVGVRGYRKECCFLSGL